MYPAYYIHPPTQPNSELKYVNDDISRHRVVRLQKICLIRVLQSDLQTAIPKFLRKLCLNITVFS